MSILKYIPYFKRKRELDTNRAKGCMFGQSVGDALGLGSEFMCKTEVETYYPDGLTDYSQIWQDRHRRRWHKGDWTDDTDMMLCIANAIIETGKADYLVIARNFKDWLNGTPMGIGQNTYNVLSLSDYESNPMKAAEIVWEMSRRQSAANGGVMRTSVIGLLPNDVIRSAEDTCKLTHFDPRCIGSCVIVSSIIHSLVYENRALSYDEIIEIGERYDNSITEFVEKAYYGQFEDVDLEDDSMGYTLHCLFAALWCYFHVRSFEEGLLKVVNAGGDADTNAAVACSILGAKYGFDAIPTKFIDCLYHKDIMTETFEKLIKAIKQ